MDVIAARAPEPVGVVLTNLDRFIYVNHEHGHPFGDQVLVEFARRFAAAAPIDHVATRYGGDVFIDLVPGVDDIEQIKSTARTFLRMCDAPITIGDVTLEIRLSAGIAIAPPGDLMEGLRTADAAMFAAKARGRARAVCLDPEWEAT
jgi:diguanylate cyclase (GGDEF)-like protein